MCRRLIRPSGRRAWPACGCVPTLPSVRPSAASAASACSTVRRPTRKSPAAPRQRRRNGCVRWSDRRLRCMCGHASMTTPKIATASNPSERDCKRAQREGREDQHQGHQHQQHAADDRVDDVGRSQHDDGIDHLLDRHRRVGQVQVQPAADEQRRSRTGRAADTTRSDACAPSRHRPARWPLPNAGPTRRSRTPATPASVRRKRMRWLRSQPNSQSWAREGKAICIGEGRRRAQGEARWHALSAATVAT